MSQILNSLIISEGTATLHALEKVMSINLEGYILSFLRIPMAELEDLDRVPDLVFIENGGNLSPGDVQGVVRQFPHTTCVVLDEHGDMDRRLYLRAGADEVMSLADLDSIIGKHLIEKLLAFKELADARSVIAQSEERFKGVIENSHDIILLLDAEGSIVYTSPAFQRRLGYEEWEVLGRDFTAYVHEEDAPDIKARLHDIVSAPPTQATDFEFRIRKRDDGWRDFEAVATNLLRNVTVQSVVINMRDVTAQKENEAELAQYRDHLERLVEKRTREVAEAHQQADTVVAASPDALIAIDDQGIITFISDHYRKLYPDSAHLLKTGRHIDEAFGVVTREIGLKPDDQRYKEMIDWWHAPKGSKEFRMNNGTWVRLQARRRQDDKGTVISSTNISEYKRQQALLAAQSEELAIALAKERAIVEQQKTFVSMVSHEFRTPLTIIDGNAQILHSRGVVMDKESLQKRTTTIRQAVERLVRLIESILSAHMIDSGKLNTEMKSCDIAAILNAAALDQQDISPRHKIRVALNDMPPLFYGDEKILRQIISNLLSNAVKYSPVDTADRYADVHLRARGENGYVVIEVQDSGVGIPESELPRISTKYFRASTSGGIPGTGLGLSLVRQFVDLHAGQLDIRSTVGVGTVVSVSLPVAATADKTMLASQQSSGVV